ncbi:cation transporter [Candidatus Obscuribacterales bacterium]|nr:cation transporter [Candidatus Obscuribacterales bacterium]MBX3149693.1 cation transporter [Candidatus Obscuribacterales bacterium]
MSCETIQNERSDQSSNMRAARRVFVQTLGLNLIVALAKLICGTTSNILSMTADGFHSLLDASSNIVGIIALSVAIKPADNGHPYGHRKFEALASICISFLLFFAGLHIITTAIDRCLFGAAVPQVTTVSYVVIGVTILINFFVSRYEKVKSKELNSQILHADSEHTMSDIYVSFSVLAAVVAARFSLYWIDLLASLVIVGVIVHAGFTIISRNLGSLVDAVVVDSAAIEKLVLAVPGVISCHAIRSRGVSDHMFIDLHVEVSPYLSVAAGHAIASEVEKVLIEKIEGVADVTVHIEDFKEHAGVSAVESQGLNDQ